MHGNVWPSSLHSNMAKEPGKSDSPPELRITPGVGWKESTDDGPEGGHSV